MQSVPESAVEGEGLPTADQLNDLSYGVGENQAQPDQPDQGDKVIVSPDAVVCFWAQRLPSSRLTTQFVL